jgi:hypothetical protein
MSIREGRWDCPACGTIGVRGPLTRCPNCGSPRPRDVRFYLPDDSALVSDEASLAAARAGADWVCGHCHAQNKAADADCRSCGNPRDESSQDVALEEREYSLEETPRASAAAARTLHPLEQAQPRRRGRGRGLLLAGGLLLAAFLLLRFFPQQIEVQAEAFRWERSLQMERNEVVAKEEWSTPPGAFDVQSFQAVRSYRQVLRGYETRTRSVRVQVGEERYPCGQIDKGNGYFETRYCTRPVYENRTETYEEPVYDQVPVYDTKYRFKVYEWVSRPEALLRSAGEGQQPQWPAPSPKPDGKSWREGERQERYFVTVREPDGDRHEHELSFEAWGRLSPGAALKARRSWLFDWYYGLDSGK